MNKSQQETQHTVQRKPWDSLTLTTEIWHQMWRLHGVHAPQKLSGLCSQINRHAQGRATCSTNHVLKFVLCTRHVVYHVPLSCRKAYISQTGRCLNNHLGEPKASFPANDCAHPPSHCRQCRCTPAFDNTRIFRLWEGENPERKNIGSNST